MNIFVNGEARQLNANSANVVDLLSFFNVEMPEMISVEVNDAIIPRDQFSTYLLSEGDRVEFMYFMGGGSGFQFSDEQLERYSRQLLMEEVGGAGQAKLTTASVLVIGAGGLGSPACYYLAAAGVGRIGIVDYDDVELSNLQRQILHSTSRIGVPKADSAKQTLVALNPHVRVETHKIWADADNILELIADYDIVIDGVDNFGAKFLINDACVLRNKPFVHGGVLRFQGQLFTHIPQSGCLRCIFPTPPPDDVVPTCASAGVLGATAGVVGVLQATEALKYILGAGELLTNRILSVDALSGVFKTMNFKPNNNCPVCGDTPSIFEPEEIRPPSCDL